MNPTVRYLLSLAERALVAGVGAALALPAVSGGDPWTADTGRAALAVGVAAAVNVIYGVLAKSFGDPTSSSAVPVAGTSLAQILEQRVAELVRGLLAGLSLTSAQPPVVSAVDKSAGQAVPEVIPWVTVADPNAPAALAAPAPQP